LTAHCPELASRFWLILQPAGLLLQLSGSVEQLDNRNSRIAFQVFSDFIQDYSPIFLWSACDSRGADPIDGGNRGTRET
jgi:hypothetical protein